MKVILGFMALLTVGCTQFKQHTGEFQPYLCKTLKDHGATLPKSIPLCTNLPSSWQTKSDQYGIVILAPLSSFSSIDQILRGILGKPQMWDEKDATGGRHGVYNFQAAGCAVQYFEGKNNTEVIILKNPQIIKPPPAGAL